MINTIKGDILQLKEGILVHGCNSLGVMGAGIALKIKQVYPLAYEAYRQQYEVMGLGLGEVIPYTVSKEPHLIIANAITQDSFGREKGLVYLDYAAIRKCFSSINEIAKLYHLSVNFPLIGCGLAGGNWDIVAGIIESEVSDKITKNLWVLE